MNTVRVVSSHIRNIGHDETAAILEVQFTDGKIYHYHGVDATVFQAFLAAPSKGRFFDQKIKDRYPFTRE